MIEKRRTGSLGNTLVRWLVSCKHKAHSGKSVVENDEECVKMLSKGLIKADIIASKQAIEYFEEKNRLNKALIQCESKNIEMKKQIEEMKKSIENVDK